MQNIDLKKIEKLPVVMLGSFGHAGIDWLHSLLDNHNEILIMPAFSFFRSLDRIEHNFNVSFKKLTNKEIVEMIGNLFLHDKSYQVKRRKILINIKFYENFKKSLFEYLVYSKEKNIEKKIFYGIHYSYCKIYDIKLNNKKIIVSHEHVSWHCEKYLKIFNSKFLFIFRDPRAVLGGGILRMRNSNPDRIINSLQFDIMILDMISVLKFLIKNENKNNCYPILNEKMHFNLDYEMKNLSNWLGVSFADTMMKQTFMGVEWKGESSYLAKDELDNYPPENYYLPENVEKRWRSILSKKEILLIEVIFKKVMSKFKYNFDNHLDFKNKMKGFFFYFTIHQKQDKYYFNKYIILIRNLFRRLIILLIGKQFKKLFKFK